MTTAQPDAADLVLLGGRVFTADPSHPWAEAVAVRGERIVAVGPDREVRAHINPRSRVIELRGRSVTPGFQDAHVHPIHSGIDRLRVDLADLRGLDAYLARIAEYATAHPDAEWILGSGWSLADFPGGVPRREDLDRVVPGRPVFIPNRDGHDAWVSTRALELAGIDRDTPDPADGRIARDPDGAVLGTLHEGAQALMERVAPPATAAELEQALLESQRFLHSLGITAWQDAIVEPADHVTYLAVAGRGDLTARVVGAQWWERTRGFEQLEELVARRAEGPVGRYAPTSVKLMCDGIVENHTASMLDPYLDGRGGSTDNRGLDFIDPAVMREIVVRIDALGFQPHFHALGDRAVRQALDAVEAARAANGPSDTRPHLAHLQFVHPDDRPRFRRLGAVANAQPLWAVLEEQMAELTLPFVTAETAARQYPWRSLRRAGATLAMGSDWSVSTADPFLQMEVAVHRVEPEERGTGTPFYPEERIELVDAVTAFTAGSAYVNHLDDTGVIAPGRLADLAILDRDLFDEGHGPIGETRVLATVVGGVAVHEAPGLEG